MRHCAIGEGEMEMNWNGKAFLGIVLVPLVASILTLALSTLGADGSIDFPSAWTQWTIEEVF
jgi:hypothetical protein